MECGQQIKAADYRAAFFVPTGVGKARILIEAAKELYSQGKIKSIVYVCDNTEMRDVDFPAQMKLWNASHLIGITTFLCYATAYKMPEMQADLVMFDEADYAASAPQYIKSFFNILSRYILICSATGTEAQKEFLSALAPIVYERSLKEVEDMGVVNRSKYYFINYAIFKEENDEYISLTKDIARAQATKNKEKIQLATLKRKHFLSSLFSSRLATKELLKYIKNHKPEARVLVFSQLTEQVDKIVRHTFHEKNAKDNNLEKFNNLEFDICGVVGKVVRGKNLVKVDHIVYESLTSSSTRMLQSSGRGKRLDKNEFSHVYFLIPHFFKKGKVYSTVVEDWTIKAIQKLNIDSFQENWIDYGK